MSPSRRSSGSGSSRCSAWSRRSSGVVNQLLAFGSRTLLPSAEAAYPWLLALFATSLFSGFGIARRLQGGTAHPAPTPDRRDDHRRGRDAARPGSPSRRSPWPTTSPCATGRSRRRASARPSAPTSRHRAMRPLTAGPTARLDLHMSADRRPAPDRLGRPGRRPRRARLPLAGATSPRAGSSASSGAARIGDQAWTIAPGSALASRSSPRPSTPTRSMSRRSQVALTPGYRATAEDRGVEVIEGARARRCRVAVDGPIFAEAFPQIALARRRGRPPPLARPARLLGLPRRPARPGRRAASTARRRRSSRTRSTARSRSA